MTSQVVPPGSWKMMTRRHGARRSFAARRLGLVRASGHPGSLSRARVLGPDDKKTMPEATTNEEPGISFATWSRPTSPAARCRASSRAFRRSRTATCISATPSRSDGAGRSDESHGRGEREPSSMGRKPSASRAAFSRKCRNLGMTIPLEWSRRQDARARLQPVLDQFTEGRRASLQPCKLSQITTPCSECVGQPPLHTAPATSIGSRAAPMQIAPNRDSAGGRARERPGLHLLGPECPRPEPAA